MRLWYARMLLDRAEPAEGTRAEALLVEAGEVCRAIGMPRYLEMVEAMLADIRAARRGALAGRDGERGSGPSAGEGAER